MGLTALSIFGAEAVIMGFFLVIPPMQPIVEALIDSTLVTAIAIPILYFYLYRPMTSYIAEHAQIQSEIHRQSLHDTLTALPNRLLFQDRLEHEIKVAHRNGAVFAVVIFDIDRFSEINDTLGHQNGDQLLQQIATRLNDHWRKSDSIARFGADEFALLLCSVNLDVAVLTVEKLQELFATPFIIEKTSIEIEISCGISLYPDHGESAALLMQRADSALNSAKTQTESYAVYATESDRNSVRRLTMFGQLRNAIQHGELILHYQPKVDVKSGKVNDVEALVRWRHPELGLIAPGEFIPLAERTNLIKPLTDWVVDTTLQQIKAWGSSGPRVRIAVNFSARNLSDSSLPKRIGELISRTNIKPTMLIGEITESAVMTNPQRAMDILERLNEMGIDLSIDDFGTGFGSLTYLRTLPVKEIKIDQSFVRDIIRDQHDLSIVRSVIDLAKSLDLKVTAEGVETREIFDALERLGCDKIQGYYISRPLPADEFAHWMADQK